MTGPGRVSASTRRSPTWSCMSAPMPARSTSIWTVRAMRERLYRSRTDRMLFGVAGGMADWLGIDPSVVRLVWALLVLAGGVGLVLYIVAAIVVPEAPVGYGGAQGSTPTGQPFAAGA